MSEVDPAAKQQAAGSIWNTNSWHWEQKNYSDTAQEMIKQRLAGLSFSRDGVSFTAVKVPRAWGHAEISIRKGKQIIVYELNADLEWNAESDVDECAGSCKITDINESDLDFEVTDFSVKAESDFARKARALLKKCLKDEVIKLVKDFRDDLSTIEGDPQKLENDKKKREENENLLKKVISEKAKEKDRMLEEQRRIDYEKILNKKP